MTHGAASCRLGGEEIVLEEEVGSLFDLKPMVSEQFRMFWNGHVGGADRQTDKETPGLPPTVKP